MISDLRSGLLVNGSETRRAQEQAPLSRVLEDNLLGVTSVLRVSFPHTSRDKGAGLETQHRSIMHRSQRLKINGIPDSTHTFDGQLPGRESDDCQILS